MIHLLYSSIHVLIQITTNIQEVANIKCYEIVKYHSKSKNRLKKRFVFLLFFIVC